MLTAWSEGRADLAGATGRFDDFRSDSTSVERQRTLDHAALEAF